MLQYMDRESFYNLQSLLRSVCGVIWVTGGGGSASTKAQTLEEFKASAGLFARRALS
jgi:hypothetical protein